jgi:hypothetical protein
VYYRKRPLKKVRAGESEPSKQFPRRVVLVHLLVISGKSSRSSHCTFWVRARTDRMHMHEIKAAKNASSDYACCLYLGAYTHICMPFSCRLRQTTLHIRIFIWSNGQVHPIFHQTVSSSLSVLAAAGGRGPVVQRLTDREQYPMQNDPYGA